MSDQMSLHRNKSSGQSSMNFKGAAQTNYVKESHFLSRERITVMISVVSEKQSPAPKVEFVFKGVRKRLKLNVPQDVTVEWAPKGPYRLKHVLQFIERFPA